MNPGSVFARNLTFHTLEATRSSLLPDNLTISPFHGDSRTLALFRTAVTIEHFARAK